MAKYEANYSCGHSETVTLFGKHSERERKLEWYARSGQCSACFAAKKQAERETAVAKAAESAQQKGLPPLVGSEKQVAWAEQLRQRVLGVIGKIGSTIEQDFGPREGEPDAASPAARWSTWEDCYAWLCEQTAAKWWIDRDSKNPLETILTECPHAEALAQASGGERQVVILGMRREWIEKQAAADAQAEKQRVLEGKKDSAQTTANQIAAVLGVSELSVNVWSNDAKTKRVYCDFGKKKIAYHHTGDKYNAKGKIEGASAADADTLRPLFESLCTAWNSLRLVGVIRD